MYAYIRSKIKFIQSFRFCMLFVHNRQVKHIHCLSHYDYLTCTSQFRESSGKCEPDEFSTLIYKRFTAASVQDHNFLRDTPKNTRIRRLLYVCTYICIVDANDLHKKPNISIKKN